MAVFIKEISFYDDLLYSGLSIPPLGTYHIYNSQSKDGFILGACIEEKIVGIAVIEFSPRPRLTYIFVAEVFRGNGVGTQLVRAALAHADAKGAVKVEACAILQNEYGDVCGHILSKTGFVLVDTATVIRYASDGRCRGLWTAYMEEKGTRIQSILARRGFRTLPFSKASPETFDRLEASIGKEYVPNLDPFRYISDQNDRILPDYSFITLKDDEPAAFITVTTADDKSLVFQQISIALKYQGSGVFLQPFAAFMERFLTGEVYSKVAAVIYGNNDKMQRLVHSFIGSFSESMKTQNMYKCVLER